jgi:hypothetical protein
MSSTTILIIGAVYLYIACDKAYRGELGLGIAFLGYAIGNVGLYIAGNK